MAYLQLDQPDAALEKKTVADWKLGFMKEGPKKSGCKTDLFSKLKSSDVEATCCEFKH